MCLKSILSNNYNLNNGNDKIRYVNDFEQKLEVLGTGIPHSNFKLRSVKKV
jgi:hypothetical protein